TKSRYFEGVIVCLILEQTLQIVGDDVEVAWIRRCRRHLLVRQSEVAAGRQQKQGQKERRMGDVLEGRRPFPLTQDQSQRSLGHRSRTMRKVKQSAIFTRTNTLIANG